MEVCVEPRRWHYADAAMWLPIDYHVIGLTDCPLARESDLAARARVSRPGALRVRAPAEIKFCDAVERAQKNPALHSNCIPAIQCSPFYPGLWIISADSAQSPSKGPSICI